MTGGYPDDAVRVSCDNDVLRVPLVHLRHAAAQDLLAAAREGVGAGDGAAVDAPHVDVGAGTGHDVALHKHTSGCCVGPPSSRYEVQNPPSAR